MNCRAPDKLGYFLKYSLHKHVQCFEKNGLCETVPFSAHDHALWEKYKSEFYLLYCHVATN